jgi:hypothetical protein
MLVAGGDPRPGGGSSRIGSGSEYLKQRGTVFSLRGAKAAASAHFAPVKLRTDSESCASTSFAITMASESTWF